MTISEVFAAWAPDDGPWSPWAKPVLFAHLSGVVTGEPHLAAVAVPTDAATSPLPPLPPADGRTAIVVDLPGAQSLSAGLALAAVGYRPVPLYNAVPPPATALGKPAAAVVDVAPLLAGLRSGAAALLAGPPPADAPPAFLLDRRRRGEGVVVLDAGTFDNRSVALETDFPSGVFLRSRGVERAVVLQPDAGPPMQDLRHVLAAWQKAGVRIEVQHATATADPAPVTVSARTTWPEFWRRAAATLGLRRGAWGGFGGFVPEPSSGGAG